MKCPRHKRGLLDLAAPAAQAEAVSATVMGAGSRAQAGHDVERGGLDSAEVKKTALPIKALPQCLDL
jgi:hypothetical protein